MPIEKRNWTTYNYAALWISMAHCIPTYMMASGLIYTLRKKPARADWQANRRVAVATILGCFFAWIGLIIPSLRFLYDYAWFVGFDVSFVAYFVLMKMFPPLENLTERR